MALYIARNEDIPTSIFQEAHIDLTCKGSFWTPDPSSSPISTPPSIPCSLVPLPLPVLFASGSLFVLTPIKVAGPQM